MSLSRKQRSHLMNLQLEIAKRVANKYVGGATEHGGNLWEKEGLLDEAIDEAVDMLVYLLTEKDKRENRDPASTD